MILGCLGTLTSRSCGMNLIAGSSSASIIIPSYRSNANVPRSKALGVLDFESRSPSTRPKATRTLDRWRNTGPTCLKKQRHFRKRVGSGSLFHFFELRVTPGFTQRGVLVSIRVGVVSAIVARCCDDRISDRDLSAVPRNARISILQTSPASFGLRTLSVSLKSPPRFNTPFGTANRTQP